jgi:peptidoglycan hydrolase-like protein with peptidoglycan-binding domain
MTGLMTGTIALALATPGVAQLAAGSARPELYLGVQSESVSELQGMLRLLGFFRGEVSGLYGDDTQNAVIQFQTAAGILPNGRVSGSTWSKLFPGTVVAGAPVAAPAKPVVAVPKPAAPMASSFPKPAVPAAAPTKPAVAPAKPAVPAPAKPAVAPAKPAVAAAPMFPILRKGDRGPAVETLQKRLVRLGVLSEGADGVFGEATHKAVMAAQQRFKIEADGIVGPATWDALLQ